MLLYQIDSGYCYNSDSYFLYDFIARHSLKGSVLDVGSGSGFLGLLIARDHPHVRVEGIEKQPPYVTLARRNAQINHLDYVVHEGDFLTFAPTYRYDVILSNPPFYHEGASRSLNPLIHQARYNVHLPIEAFAHQVQRLLTPQGEMFLCYDARQFSSVAHAFERVGLRVVEVQFVHSKLDRPSTLVLMRLKKNSRALMQVLPPLITFEGEHISSRVRAIYQRVKVHSIKCPIS